ncbi:putative ABC transporter permease/ATP-binding protein [Ilumatobacter coccineus YM16-304]|uniref:Putative ABC transporter permease/ATP-binding protein n=2 Tax=Ilumatobacter coccineus TaxID=467094 RepID=A0A6C7E674_ILUCY|nr:putative ABC transporter permease/ATP-binding protein [Ilumatobacter coccineus YM16-304]
MFRMGGIDDDDKLDSEATKRVLRRAIRMGAPFKKTVFTALAFVALSTTGLLLGPVIVRYGIDNGIDGGDRDVLRNAVIAYAIVVVVAYVAARQQYIFVNRAGEGLLQALRVRTFDHIQKQSLAFFDRYQSGVLISRMTADIESMAELVQWGLLQFVAAVFLISIALLLMLALSWELTLVALLVMPIIIIASRKFQRDSNAAYLVVRERVGQNLAELQEGISGVRVIQAYAQEGEQTRQFVESNRSLYKSHVHSIRVSTWYFGLVEAMGVFATALAIGIGGWLENRGDVSVGTIVAFVLLLSALFEPVQQLSQLYNTVQSSAAALNKLFTILDTEPDIQDGTHDLPHRGELVVDDIGFTYPATDTPVLGGVSLRVADGERLALVGPTGAGKSTVAKLMARLYDPTVGSISLGGIDLRDATLDSLRERIVVVPQEGFLFGGSIADNVRIARPGATDAELRAALDAIGALERFEEFEDGIDTEVRERGSRLSAGERQLVSLARAALVDPAVLVLDEATSNLDPGTEVIVERALDRLMNGRTTIVVAHRLSTIKRADRIAVISGGRLTELGSHDELVDLGGHYAELSSAWESSLPR